MRPRALLLVGACLLAALTSFIFLTDHHSIAMAAASSTPAYTQGGDMLPPTNYREWTYLTTGVDMSYSAKAADMTMFDNVFVNPEAYRSFVATGTWPDKTVVVLEVREAKDRGSINQHGHYQGSKIMGFEVHVKDESRFPGKWAFFDFDTPQGTGTLIPQGAPCYTCHQSHAAVDTTFVQFYPTLLPIATDKKTLSAAYAKEEVGPAAK